MEPYLNSLVGFHQNWNDSDNICLSIDEDLFFFERDSLDVYYGHYFCKSRGKEVLERSNQILFCMFETHGAKVIKGLTPMCNLPARWLSRKLGFSSYGTIDTIVEPMELFILTKNEWEKIHE